MSNAAQTIVWPKIFISDARQSPDQVWGDVREPAYPKDCPNCGGIGRMSAFYIGAQPEGGERLIQAWVNGRLQSGIRRYQPCPKCGGDIDHQRSAWLAAQSGLIGDELDKTLGSFRAVSGKQAGRDTVAGLLSADRPAGFVTLYGEYGTGKTHLLMAAVNGWRLLGKYAVYIRMADLLQEVRDGYKDNSAETILMRYKHADCLAVDEIDRAKMSEWAQEQIFRLLDSRYRWKDSRLTIMATNLRPAEFPDSLGYLSSRMAPEAVEVSGLDMRTVVK